MPDLLETLLIALAGGLFANLIELPIIWWFSRPNRLLDRLKHPDPDVIGALTSLFRVMWNTANDPCLESGRKDEKGKPEIITPIEALVDAAGDSIVNRLRGLQGSVVKAAQSVGEAAFGIPLPRKGQSSGEFVIEQILMRLTPVIDQKVEEFINNLGKNRGGGGGFGGEGLPGGGLGQR